MLRTLALLCFIAASALGAWEGSLKVRFDLNIFGIGSTAFIELPQSDRDAVAAGWVQTPRPEDKSEGALADLTMWCPRNDYTVCIMTDDTGFVAGQQIALDEESYTDSIYDWTVQGFTRWTIEQNGITKNFETAQIYFITPEFLEIPAADRIANRNDNVLLQDRAIMVSGFNGTLYRISTRVNEISNPTSDWTRQACVPWMGRHYYYKMTKTTECRADTLLPWFPLVYDDQVVGVGMVTFGKHVTYPSSDVRTNYFEEPDTAAVKLIVPEGPQCLYDLPSNPGLVTLHTYFIRHPYQLTCLFN